VVAVAPALAWLPATEARAQDFPSRRRPTPPAVVAKLNAAVVAAIDAPDVREKLPQSGAVPAPTSSAEFGKVLADEYARWGRVVREKGIKED
jgi:tripartite-type tricarboxylate transporter receptor subunit TctC